MSEHDESGLPPDVAALIGLERAVPELPPDIHARMKTRLRAALAPGGGGDSGEGGDAGGPSAGAGTNDASTHDGRTRSGAAPGGRPSRPRGPLGFGAGLLLGGVIGALGASVWNDRAVGDPDASIVETALGHDASGAATANEETAGDSPTDESATTVADDDDDGSANDDSANDDSANDGSANDDSANDRATNRSAHDGRGDDPARANGSETVGNAPDDREPRRARVATHPPEDPPADLLAEERRLLDAARGQLAGHDAEGALRAIARHEARFPAGVLTEEREGLRVAALIEAGDLEQAEERAAAFRATYPDSLQWPGLRRRLERARAASDE